MTQTRIEGSLFTVSLLCAAAIWATVILLLLSVVNWKVHKSINQWK